MCLFGNKPPKQQFHPTPQPEKTADPLEVGVAREAEDQTLFGGQPNLSVNRDTVAPGVVAGGTGLRMN